MNNLEILQRYKAEVNSSHYREIHDKYKKELTLLKRKYEVKNYLSIPLAIVAVVIAICCVLCIVFDEPMIFFILSGVLIVELIVRKVNNLIVENKADKNYRNGTAYSSELIDLRRSYLDKYDSVIGYFDSVNDCCCDYDEKSECYYCCVTGKRLDYPQYVDCEKKYAFQRCEYSRMYFDNLYDD
ncbi:MAG: hypothetical protein PUE75_04370 [Eubacteriales bacterium]|nr:hypothetical protein [Eubacteriales bacterium]